MKNVLDSWRMMTIAFLIISALGVVKANAQGSVSLQVFYDELQPYGTWMDHGQYGYVWLPRVDPGFTPYATNGYWIQTEYGNTWVSDYAWGWAPFHYGRWAFDDFYGWIWVPDTEWAPAWVAWRSGGGYYGWAPLMPGISMQMAYHHYYGIPHHHWNFVPYRYITYRHVYTHCIPRPRIVNIIHHTTIVTHHYTDHRRRSYFSGPSRKEIERTNRRPVEVYKINDSHRPGRTEIARGTANFYKPEIDNSKESRTRSMPTTYVRRDRTGNLEQVESRGERTSELPTTRRTDNLRYRESSAPNETIERKPAEVNRNVPQRQYTPSPRTTQREVEDRTLVYEPTQRERQPVIRDQQDFSQRERTPQIQRQRESQVDQNIQREQVPVNREVQRRTTAKPQQWQQTERQSRPAPSQNVQRQRSFNPEPARSSDGQSQRQQQIRRSDSDNSNRQPTRSSNGSRQNIPRQRN